MEPERMPEQLMEYTPTGNNIHRMPEVTLEGLTYL
jgi:hypothetical protein